MIRIHTGSRLHFGLFSLPSEQAGPWLNDDGEPTLRRRHFGGVGLMIDKPGIEVIIEEAGDWSAEGPLADRALHFAQAYCASMKADRRFRIHVSHAAPEHVGLGTGTQLGLAVAGCLEKLFYPSIDIDHGFEAISLAQRIGRGLRSAIGIHGFARGGFLVEAGKAAADEVSPLAFNRDFPAAWHLLLILPHGLQGTHGKKEVQAFAELSRHAADDRVTDTLCRIVLLGMIPAMEQFDLAAFGEALFDFNRRSGAMFKPAQGGIYCHARVENIVSKMRELGVKGVGQSSWGPALFAIVQEDEVRAVSQRLVASGLIGEHELIATNARNSPTQGVATKIPRG